MTGMMESSRLIVLIRKAGRKVTTLVKIVKLRKVAPTPGQIVTNLTSKRKRINLKPISQLSSIRSKKGKHSQMNKRMVKHSLMEPHENFLNPKYR